MMKNQSAYIWGLMGKLGPQLLYLFTTFILARYISPDDFGKIGVLAIFTSVSQTLLEAGLGGSLIKEEHVTQLDYSTIFVFNIVVSFVLYIILFLSSPWIEHFYNIEGLSLICRLLCLVFVINSWGLIAQTILFREIQFKKLMVSSIISVIVGSIIAIFTAIWLKWGVFSLVAYQLFQSFTYVLFNWHYCTFNLSFKFSILSFKKLFSFGFFTTAVGIIESLYENLITSLFGKYLNIGQAGYLSQAKRIETASVNSLSSTVNNVAFPILTRLRNNKLEFQKEANILLRNLSMIIIPILFLIALLSDTIVTTLLGSEWSQSAPYLVILMWVGCFFILEAANRNFIKSLGYIKSLLNITLIKRIIAIIVLVACICINVKFLIYGYFIGSIIGYFANAICYSKISGYNYFTYAISSLKYLLLPLCIYLLLLLLKLIIFKTETITYISVVLMVFAIYYLIILPQIGINLINLIGIRKNN